MWRPRWIRPTILALGFCSPAVAARNGAAADGDASVARGKDLFAREWLPGDSRSRGGDGLGPLYNETSCIACHNLGAPGGAGAAGKNTEIITAVPKNPTDRPALAPAEGPATQPDPDELVKLHGGFRTVRSTLLHRFGTDPDYIGWRFMMVGALGEVDQREVLELRAATGGGDGVRFGVAQTRKGKFMAVSARPEGFTLVRSRRNSAALFGAGLIDAIPDRAIEQAADDHDARFPEIVGRVSRLKDGRIGRFGWKAQTPTLADAVLTSCAVDLGLEVPGRHQAGPPVRFRPEGAAGSAKPRHPAVGLDLDADDCAALVGYVARLPAPAARQPSDPRAARFIQSGRGAFERIGCAACHRPRLGDVDGIYSDLLLHDLGTDLGDTSTYSVFVPGASEETQPDESSRPVAVAKGPRAPTGVPTREEWRTPPLWGVRDSAPYLHDGRARTLEQAIALHGGEAEATSGRFFKLDATERLEVLAFLKSLVAP
jgi:CxxC motif-containing protein (DUF1111 family)